MNRHPEAWRCLGLPFCCGPLRPSGPGGSGWSGRPPELLEVLAGDLGLGTLAAPEMVDPPGLGDLLTQGFQDGVFPGCVLVHGQPAAGRARILAVGFRGLSRHRTPIGFAQLYDLASLTKVAATTVLVMKAVDRGLLSLQTLLADLNLGISKDQKPLTIEHLLTHQSGFPAWRPFHVDPELADKDRLLKAIVRERLLFEPGQATVYSDLNFLLLGLILEKLWAASLSELFDREVAAPLELKVTGYDSKGFAAAPTEDGPRVGGPLGWPGALILGAVPTGRVHDDNAAALGGAAGHAGLFGSAPELWRIVRDLAKTWSKDEGVLCRRRTLTAFMAVRSTPVDPGRAAGFDIGQGPLAGAFGHLGYTGGSIWWDPAGDRAFVFLSNRVHPTARNSKITGFRRQLAEILWPALG